ncbi:MAG: hypothetical protein D6799_01590 [Bacteroidetes bacterium]|nr:MAG: hypothetical protein D6799_01590 [Bacteroidota bacterium]
MQFFYFLSLCLLFLQTHLLSQNVADTIYLMNGQKIGSKVIDTSFALVTYKIPTSSQPDKIRNLEKDDIFCIRYKDGTNFYYYSQDTIRGDWFTRDEMWHFTQGERDARKGFKPIATSIIGGTLGALAGMTGMYVAPALPLGFYLISDITKIKIRQHSISNPELLQYDAYILGYQKVSRSKRRIHAIISGASGLLLGYITYFSFKNQYPQPIKDILFN